MASSPLRGEKFGTPRSCTKVPPVALEEVGRDRFGWPSRCTKGGCVKVSERQLLSNCLELIVGKLGLKKARRAWIRFPQASVWPERVAVQKSWGEWKKIEGIVLEHRWVPGEWKNLPEMLLAVDSVLPREIPQASSRTLPIWSSFRLAHSMLFGVGEG